MNNLDDATSAPDTRRRALVWESALGFCSFFTLLAGIQAVWNLFRPSPSVSPALLFGVCLLLTWLVWRRWRQLR